MPFKYFSPGVLFHSPSAPVSKQWAQPNISWRLVPVSSNHLLPDADSDPHTLAGGVRQGNHAFCTFWVLSSTVSRPISLEQNRFADIDTATFLITEGPENTYYFSLGWTV